MPLIRRDRPPLSPDPSPPRQTGAPPPAAEAAPGEAPVVAPQQDEKDEKRRRHVVGALVTLGATTTAFVGGASLLGGGKHPQLQARDNLTTATAEPFSDAAADPLPRDPRDAVVRVPRAPSPTDVPTTIAAPPAPVDKAPLQPALDGLFAVESASVRTLAPGVHHHALAGAMGGRQVVHVVEIDLDRPEYDVTSNRAAERGLTVSQYAERARPVVAINADFFDMATRQPRGLAIADGEVWPGTGDLPDHTVMGCTAEDVCTFDAEGEVKHDPAWQDAVGMNGARLVVDGAVRRWPGAFYETDRHPRAAVALTDDRRMLLFAFEGRLGDAAGTTWNETAEFVARFPGVVQAGMLDGGGSMTLVHTDDAGHVHRLNRVPGGGAERPVANVLAIRSSARG